MDLNTKRLHSQLILEEGLRLMAYDDATGHPIPPGGNCRGKLTVGVGRNLDGNPLSNAEVAHVGHDARTKPITLADAMFLLDNDIAAVCRVLDIKLPWWKFLDEIRARVIVDMCFNMGIDTLLKFKNTLTYVRTGDYASAADGMKKSLWYNQVGSRGVRLEAMMRSGEDWTA